METSSTMTNFKLRSFVRIIFSDLGLSQTYQLKTIFFSRRNSTNSTDNLIKATTIYTLMEDKKCDRQTEELTNYQKLVNNNGRQTPRE